MDPSVASNLSVLFSTILTLFLLYVLFLLARFLILGIKYLERELGRAGGDGQDKTTDGKK